MECEQIGATFCQNEWAKVCGNALRVIARKNKRSPEQIQSITSRLKEEWLRALQEDFNVHPHKRPDGAAQDAPTATLSMLGAPAEYMPSKSLKRRYNARKKPPSLMALPAPPGDPEGLQLELHHEQGQHQAPGRDPRGGLQQGGGGAVEGEEGAETFTLPDRTNHGNEQDEPFPPPSLILPRPEILDMIVHGRRAESHQKGAHPLDPSGTGTHHQEYHAEERMAAGAAVLAGTDILADPSTLLDALTTRAENGVDGIFPPAYAPAEVDGAQEDILARHYTATTREPSDDPTWDMVGPDPEPAEGSQADQGEVDEVDEVDKVVENTKVALATPEVGDQEDCGEEALSEPDEEVLSLVRELNPGPPPSIESTVVADHSRILRSSEVWSLAVRSGVARIAGKDLRVKRWNFQVRVDL